MKNGVGLLSAVVLAVGIGAAGWFVGRGFVQARGADRYVTVKGVSEREARADIALWPLRFVSTDDDLGRAQAKIRQSHAKVLEFLRRHQLDPAAAEVHKLEVTDVLANPYRSGPTESRYIISQTLMVRSHEPDTVLRASQAVGELVDAGVVLSQGDGASNGPTFLFTRLNDLKPAMIAEATAEGRRAAEQFARDSGSRIGGIRRANQGVFEILARDRTPGMPEESQPAKTVRVVATVEYYLSD